MLRGNYKIMNEKKIQSAIISCILIISALIIITPISSANNIPCFIRGYVYVDDALTQPDDVVLMISDTEVSASDLYSDGYFEIMQGIDADIGDIGTFKISIYGQTWLAKESFTVTSENIDKIEYLTNLTIDTEDEPIDDDDTQPPSKVTGLQVSDAKDGKLDLSWNPATDNVGIDHYKIYFEDGTLITSVTTTNYRHTGLTNDNAYTYQISAVDTSSNEGEKSDPRSGTPTQSYTPPPPPPDDDDEDENDDEDEPEDEVIANNPPRITDFDGENITKGHINTKIDFYAVATDADEGAGFNKISYIFNWTDGNINTTEYVDNNTRYDISHIWSTAGIYEISVFARDNYPEEGVNGTPSEMSYLEVLIDTHKISSTECDLQGYLIDYDSDGIFDTYHHDDISNSMVYENDSYQIDSDNDSEYDYMYNPDTNECSIIEEETEESTDGQVEDSQDDNTFLYVLALIIIIILLLLFYLMSRKKEDKKKK